MFKELWEEQRALMLVVSISGILMVGCGLFVFFSAPIFRSGEDGLWLIQLVVGMAITFFGIVTGFIGWEKISLLIADWIYGWLGFITTMIGLFVVFNVDRYKELVEETNDTVFHALGALLMLDGILVFVWVFVPAVLNTIEAEKG